MNETTAITKGSAETVRQGFGESSVERRHETGSTALAAKAQAEVNARFVMALQRPRDPDVVRAKLLKECDRPSFAERAFFSLPKGDKRGRLTGLPGRIEGMSVRFAESAIRLAGNLWQQTKTIYDDDFKRMILVSIVDLETNAGYEREIVIDKTVERKEPKKGAVILGKRTNSLGDEVSIVQATEDELLQKEGSLISKVFRTLGLRLIPPDIIEDCEQRVIGVWKTEDAKDPEASRKRLLDSFSNLGVSPDELKEYLGHDGVRLTPEERLELSGLHSAIKENEITWPQAFAERRAQRTGDDAPAGAAGKSVAERIAERNAKKTTPTAGAKDAKAPSSKPPATEKDPSHDLGADPGGLGPGKKREREPGEEG